MNRIEAFLKKKRLWSEFKREFKNKKNDDFNDYIIMSDSLNVIIYAFLWEHTKRGYDFWEKLNKEWHNYI